MRNKTTGRFRGFDLPEQNWFRLPNEWTNITADMKSLAELKVVEYVLRHTWGYHEYGIAKRITINEFMAGRKLKDGTRLDRGTGLSKQSVVDGLKNSVKHGYLIEEVDNSDRARIKKSYRLRMSAVKPLDADVKILDTGTKNLGSDVKEVDTRGVGSRHRSEKDTSERTLTVSNGDLIKHLPDLGVSAEQQEYISGQVLDQLGDKHSERFYRLVAAKIPEQVIFQALSEIRVDGADNPRKAFTHRMGQYALQVGKKGIGGQLLL